MPAVELASTTTLIPLVQVERYLDTFVSNFKTSCFAESNLTSGLWEILMFSAAGRDISVVAVVMPD
jgi:hypothetical protein